MGRPSNTHERRAQITSALMRVMAKRGFDGATVADVARAARLTAGLVHYHFDDKRDILLTLVAELAAQHMATLDRRLTQAGDDPRARLEAFIDFHLGLGLDADPDRLACWILISTAAPHRHDPRRGRRPRVHVQRRGRRGGRSGRRDPGLLRPRRSCAGSPPRGLGGRIGEADGRGDASRREIAPAGEAMTGAHPLSKMGILLSLYFSQGLPFGFFAQALPVLL